MEIVMLIIAALIIFYFVPKSQDKDRFAKEAAEITKQFGKDKITLFKFPFTDEKSGPEFIYALLKFDSHNDEYEKIFDVDNYYVLTYYSLNDKRGKRQAEEKIRIIKNLLPYEIPEYTADVDFDVWEKKVREHPCIKTYSY